MRRLATYLLPLVAAGCGLDSPDGQPTWADDVKPILAANCVRCHSTPAIGGAPDSFRLDSYHDTVTADGRNLYGARLMAPFVILRADPAETGRVGIDPMPPQFGLSDRQVDILVRWFGTDPASTAPEGDAVAGNRAPTMEIIQPLDDSLVDGRLVIQYEIRDPDRETALGELRYGDSFDGGVRIGPVHAGRGELVWDVGAIAEGSYGLHARLTDRGQSHDIDLGSYDVVHADNNMAPTVALLRPAPHDIIADLDANAGYTVDLMVGDGDAADSLSVTARAVRDDVQPVMIADDMAVTAGVVNLDWDTRTVEPAGGGWRLEITVSDGQASRTLTSQPFRISHQPPDLTFANVSGLLNDKCDLACHAPNLTQLAGGVGITLGVYEDDPGVTRGAGSLRGLIYRRVIEQRTMPPMSAHVFDDTYDFTEAERDMLANWLLGGAPQ